MFAQLMAESLLELFNCSGTIMAVKLLFAPDAGVQIQGVYQLQYGNKLIE